MSQTFGDWEWCVVDDCSTRPEVLAALESLSHRDPRIRVVHAIHERRDRRRVERRVVDGTRRVRRAARPRRRTRCRPRWSRWPPRIDAAGDVDYLYTDEAHVLADGRESAHFLKPDWSPERFRSSMYTCHLSVLRRDVVDEVGGSATASTARRTTT